MRNMSAYFKKIDLFGKNFIFEEEENQKFTTSFGMINTFFIVTTCIVVGFLFGKEIYERKSPSVLNSDEKLEKSSIKMNEYPLFFGFSDGSGNNIPYAPSHIKMKVTHLNLTESSKASVYYYYDYKKCDVSEYSELYQPYVKDLYATSGQNFDIYCVLYADDLYFENEYTAPGSSFVNFGFKLCNPETQECGDIEQRDKMIKDLYIVMFYINTYIDSGEYSNPVNYYPTNKSQKVSVGLLHRLFIDVEKIKLVTHKGWLLEDIVESNILNIRSFNKDVSSVSDGSLYWVTLSSPNVRSKIIRTYMKIQDMFAKIGGFFNALFIVLTILSRNYVDFSFYQYIYMHFYKFKNPNVAVTKNIKSIVRNHTIDKIVQKLAVSDLYLSVNDKSRIMDVGLTHKSFPDIKIEEKDLNKSNINLELSKPQFPSPFTNINNCNFNNNNNSKNNINNNINSNSINNQSGMINNFIDNNKNKTQANNELNNLNNNASCKSPNNNVNQAKLDIKSKQ